MKKTFLIFISMCIAIILQAQITKTVNITTAGSLSSSLTATELSNITDLTVTGLIDQRDFVTMRDNMPVLSVINMTNSSVLTYGTYPANTIPDAAFTTFGGTTGKNTLTTVYLPSTVTTIGIGSFGHCYNLTSVTIPNSVTTISLASFVATGLTSINIPSSVTSIGQNAFLSCTSLTSVIIPSSVTNIESQAFAYCDVLKSVKVYSNTPIDLSSSANVFAGSNLTNCILYVLPATKSLFSAANQWSAFSAILDLPEYVTIANTAGNLSTALSANQLNSAISLTVSGTIDARDFLTIRDKMPLLTSIDLSSATIVGYTGTGGTDKAVSSLGIYLANTIPIDAFYSKISLLSVTLPTTITKIDEYAFHFCIGISSLTIPASVTTLGIRAFNLCSGLTSINIPASVTILSDALFCGCTKLPTVSIPSSITTIGTYAFYNCTGLNTITIPTSVKSIGTQAFYGCSGISTIVIPTSVTAISDFTFTNCTGLKSVTIPTSITSIGVEAFELCTSLLSVTIPSSVITIGSNAFAECTSLNSITVNNTVPINLSSSTTVFNNVNKNSCILNVPAGTKTAYSTANQWKDFINIVSPFELSAKTATIVQNVGSAALIEVTSSLTWTASTTASWLSVYPSVATTGNGTIVLTATSLNMSAPRTTTVTITALGMTPQTISVTQTTDGVSIGGISSVTLSKTANSNVTYLVSSNTTWNASTTTPWLTVSPTITISGNGSITITTTAENPTILARTGTIILTPGGGGGSIQNVSVIQAAGTPVVTLASNTANIAKTATSTTSISVTSNTTWTANTTASWLTLNPAIATTGNAVLNITANTNNPTIIPRTATITVTASGVTSQNITVTQAAGDTILLLSANTASFTKNNSIPVAISVTSNTSWTAITTASWLTISPLTATTGNATLTIKANSDNPNTTARTATISVLANGKAPQTITVTQDAGDAWYSISSDALSFDKTTNSRTVTITSNTYWSTLSPSTFTWYNVSPTSGGIGTTTVTITASANQTISERNTPVVIIGTGIATNSAILLTQAAGDPTIALSSNSVNIAKAANSNASISVTSNTSWTATKTVDWLSLNPSTTYTGNGALEITATSANPTITPRTATVKVYTLGISTPELITVTQAAGDTVLSVSSNTFDAFGGGSNFSVTVTSNTTWTASTKDSRVKILEPSSNTGTQILNFGIDTNPYTFQDGGKITISAVGAVDQVLLISQGAGPITFSVDKPFVTIASKTDTSINVNVSTNTQHWTATSSDNWLSVTPISNISNSEITIAAKENKTSISRTASIYINAEGANGKTITVTQEAGDPTLSVSNLQSKFSATIDTISVSVTSNTKWSVNTTDYWITIVAPVDSSNATVKLYSLANTTTEPRTASISFTTDGLNPITIIVEQAADTVLNVSELTATIASKTDTTTMIDVTSNTAWTAISKENWLTVTPNSNSFDSQITIAASENKTTIARSGTILVSANGAGSRIITVTQEAGNPTLSVSNVKSKFSAKVDTIIVSVTSNTKWTVSPSDNWITISAPVDSSNATVKLFSVANTTTEPRTATISFSAVGLNPVSITVSQTADTILTVSKISTIIASKTDTTSAIDVTSNTAWTVASSQSWLTSSKLSGTNNATIVLFATQNKTILSRSAIVTVKAIGAQDQIITVIQLAGDTVLTISQGAFAVQSNIDTVSVNIISNSTWTVLAPQSWISVSPSNKTGNGVVQIIIAKNNSVLLRTATISISINGAREQIITITQNAGIAVISAAATANIGDTANSSITIPVTSNTDWNAITLVDWLTISQSTSTGNGSLIIYALANPTNSPRTAKILLLGIGALSQTITVIQAASTGTLINEFESISNSIYPNPASSSFSVKTASNADVLVYTSNGILVLRKNGYAGEHISIENLPVGMYHVIINTENGITDQKLIKE
jgi:hypothetical protein